MGVSDDLDGMGPSDLDVATLEDLLTGTVPPAEVPASVRGAATLLHKARQPATAEELRGRGATARAFSRIAQDRSTARTRARASGVLLKFPTKVVVVAMPVALLGVGVAAATDSLPPSTQAAVSNVLSQVGISVPGPQNDGRVPPAPAGATPSAGTAQGNASAPAPESGSASAVPGPAGARARTNPAANSTSANVSSAPARNAGPLCTTLSGNTSNPGDPPTLGGCNALDVTGGWGTIESGGLATTGLATVTWHEGATVTFSYSTTVPQARRDQCGPDPTSPGSQETEVILRGTVQPPGHGAVHAKICVTSNLELSLLPGQPFSL